MLHEIDDLRAALATCERDMKLPHKRLDNGLDQAMSYSEPYKQKYLLLSAQHVREIELLEAENSAMNKTIAELQDDICRLKIDLDNYFKIVADHTSEIERLRKFHDDYADHQESATDSLIAENNKLAARVKEWEETAAQYARNADYHQHCRKDAEASLAELKRDYDAMKAELTKYKNAMIEQKESTKESATKV